MKNIFKIGILLLMLIFLCYGCWKDTIINKPCDTCVPRTHCENDSCVLDKGAFYSKIDGTGNVQQFLLNDFSSSIPCFYTNYSFRDTPWITPRYLAINFDYNFNDTVVGAGGSMLLIYDGVIETSGYNFDYIPPEIYRAQNGKIKRIILYQTNYDYFVRVMPNDSMLPYSHTRVVWDGIVSDDYKEINFTVKFIQPKNGIQGGPWSDTFKVINNYIMIKDPTNRENCKFCD